MPPPAVVLVDEDNASGMATMLAELLESNIRDFAGRRRVASLARGTVVFTAADRDLSVTLSFRPGTIEVSDGAAGRAPVVAAPWLVMAKVCSGLTAPWRAWREGTLHLQHLQRGPVAAAAAWALSVPSSFYESPGAEQSASASTSRSHRATAVLAASIVLVVGFVVITRHSR